MGLRIYLVDDSPEVLTRVEGILHRDTSRFEVVGSATSGRDALRDLRGVDVDVVLLDLSMPRLNGVEVLESLRTFRKDLPVVVLTSYHDAAWIRPALSAGASGYVLKTASAEELCAAVEAAWAGSFPTSVDVLEELISTAPTASPNRRVHLTQMETQVLADVVEGLTNQEIAARRYVSVGSVKLVLAALSDKLVARNRTHLATQAARHGFVSLRSATR